MAISTVMMLAPPMCASDLREFSLAAHPFNYWLLESPLKQSLKDNLSQPPSVSYYPVRIAASNPENVLYPVLIEPVRIEKTTNSAGSIAYPDISSADTLIVLFHIGIATKYDRIRHIETTTRILEYARREKPTTPMYIIGINSDRSERNLIPTKGSLRPVAHKLAEQHCAEYLECNNQYWQSWLADTDAHTTKAVMHKIYYQEVERFRRSLTPDELRRYQDNNRIPMFNLATDATRREAVQSIYRGREKPERAIKVLQLLRDKHINDKKSPAYADLHASGFWKKYDQYLEQFKQDVKRLLAVTNDIAYLDLNDADHLKCFLEIGQLRQKMEEARIMAREAESLIKYWIIPEKNHPSPTHSDTEQSSSDESHSPKGSPPRQTPVSSARPPAYNPAFQAQALPAKPEPSAPPISQKFTSNAGFFRAEPASAARGDDGYDNARERVRRVLSDERAVTQAKLQDLQQKEIHLRAKVEPACNVLARQIGEAYGEAFKPKNLDHTAKTISKVLAHPERKAKKTASLKSQSFGQKVFEKIAQEKLVKIANLLRSGDNLLAKNVSQDRIIRELQVLLDRRTKKLFKDKHVKVALKTLDQVGPQHYDTKQLIQECNMAVQYLNAPTTEERLIKEALEESRHTNTMRA